MNFSELEQLRVDKIHQMREEGREPYPTRANPTHRIAEALQLFVDHEEKESEEKINVTLAGRIRSFRTMGKIAFAHIEDGTGKIQLFFRVNELTKEGMDLLKNDFNLGDFIQAGGQLARTKTGEISVIVDHFSMLSKAILNLPAAKDVEVDGEVVQHATLSDPEVRYRQRYADLAVNPKIREIFKARAATVRALREFLDERDFLEVETPILQPIYGGAAARPFTTHHNQLKQDLYLRISFELYLKRLLVGMIDRVYEIGRDFRNEGVSYKHNPEFTQLEFYMAYADYEKIMQLTEEMLAFVCDKVLGTRKFTYQGHEIDMSPPWKRVEMRQGILDVTGIDIHAHLTGESLEAAMAEKNIHVAPGMPRGKLIDHLVGEYLEPTLIEPTFLYDYPREISPLAKAKPGDPQTVERFEGFIAGMELCNAFTELNDPLDQESRFLELGRAYDADDDEANPMDEDYLRAMSYGMPPNGGFGMGIDRLVMLLTDQHTIREVLLFPHLRERDAQ
jgi:lysyl-tRNA synthetase class 2